jgi:hypothetical protein
MTGARRGRRTRASRIVQRAIMASHRSVYRLTSGRVGGRIGANRVAILTRLGGSPDSNGRRPSSPTPTVLTFWSWPPMVARRQHHSVHEPAGEPDSVARVGQGSVAGPCRRAESPRQSGLRQ